MVYFIADIRTPSEQPAEYQAYIDEVKPIVERYGGTYLARSDRVTALTNRWLPDRVILIQWESRNQMEVCFQSAEYRRIAALREDSVDSRAVIVEV